MKSHVVYFCNEKFDMRTTQRRPKRTSKCANEGTSKSTNTDTHARMQRFRIIFVYLSSENIYFTTYYVNLITTEALSTA